ncbi:hypothetical protein QTP70_029649, partial [Hemibagrus guttatus]
MTVCSYFLGGRCRYGDQCWNEHPRGGRNQPNRGGGGSVNRVWVNPSQRSGGGVVQPSSFGRGGGDWGRGNSFTTQNRFSTLSSTQSGYGRTGAGGGAGGGAGAGAGGGDDTDKQIEMIEKDMEVWQSSGQWLFSCYAVLKSSITGFVELSPEELRMEYYTSRATGDVQSYANSVQQLVNQWRSRVQELRTMSANTRASMIAELTNPGAQTPSGGGLFSSSSSSTSAGFGSSSSTGFGSSSSTGFGSSSTSGFGSSSTSGFGSSSSGFQVGGFGSGVQSSAAGFSFSSSSPGFGLSRSQPSSSQFGSSAPSASTFSFTDPAGVTASKSSATGFSFSSVSAGAFGSSSTAPSGGAFGSSSTAPSGGAFGSSSTAPSGGAFCSGVSLAGSVEDRKGGGDGLYTPLSDLTPDEHRDVCEEQWEMSDCGLTRVMEVLRGLYGCVQTLEEFSDGVEFNDGRKPVLLQECDSERFKALTRGLMVCVESPLTHSPSSAQLCSLPEVLAFVMNRMKMKKKRNVLSFGYRSSTGRGDSDPFKFHSSISQSAAFICGSEAWAKINQRLGTDLTQYLLTHCAIFTTAPPSCLVQICGVPVYDLVPVQTWSGFFLNSCNKTDMLNRNQRIAVKKQTEVQNRRKRQANATDAVNTKKRRREDGQEEEENIGESHEEEPPAKQRRTEIIKWESEVGRSCISEDICPVQSEIPDISPAPKHGLSSWKPCDQPPSRPSHCFISVLSMLYGGHGMKGFLLNRKLQGQVGGARRIQGADVVRMVFRLKDKAQLSASTSKNQKLPKRFFAMVPIFNTLLQRHRKCPYILFLSQKCATSEGKGDTASLLSSHCSSYRVYLFVRECVRFVIPDELWGSQHNMLHFLSRVKHFLRLGKFEKLSLAHIMWKIKVSDCHWLGNKKPPLTGHCPSEHRYREWIFGQFLLWMLKDFVIGLVKSLFYVTESVSHKHALRFYRRHIWIKLQDQAFREHLSKGQWEELSPAEVTSLPKNTVTSRIRFIPKSNGMRPITRLISTGAAMQVCVWVWFQSSVRDLQNVLSVCVRERPSLLGSTVWGRRDIHRVLRSITHTHTPLYFVKVDVSGAYDSLPHSKLLEVIHDVLKPMEENRFSLRHYAKVCTDSEQEIKKHSCTRAEACELLNMKGFVMEQQNNGKLRDAILVEKLSVEVKGLDVFRFFEQMLSSYIIQYDKKLFRQVCGVPQGSAVSTMLCNLCYGHMENCVLKNITEKGGYLMRLVDDFLLITPRLSKAVDFLRTLMAGVPDYGCVINPQKVAVNFPVRDELKCEEMTEFPAHCMFPWCGLLVDTRSLHIYNDYSGYAGQSLRYSLTLGSAHSPAVFLRKKLLMILRLKCDHVLLDLQLNSTEAVYKNIYKILLLQAM